MAANPNVIPTCSVPVGFAVAAGVAGVAVAVGVGQAADWVTEAVVGAAIFLLDRELVSTPTKRPARNGHNTKSFNRAGLLTTACA